MSTFIEPVRDYKFSDARLVELGLEKIAFATRDATELATVGVTALWVAGLNTQLLAFGAMPSDEVEMSEQAEATEEKVSDADKVMDKLKELRSAAVRVFGEQSTEYKRFGFKGLDKFTDAQLLKAAMLAHGLANTYAVQLAAKGYEAADNTELQTLTADFVAGLQNQSLEIGSRDTAQENRVIAGNAAYKALEHELCEAGKSYWRTRSAAKYNDYVIHNTPSGTNGNSITVEDTLAPGASHKVELVDVEPTPASTILVEVTGTPLTFYASDNSGNILGASYVVPVGSVSMPLAEFTSLVGGGTPAAPFLYVTNPGGVDGHYKITIDGLG